MDKPPIVPSRLFNPKTSPPSLPAFKELCSRTTDPTRYPLSSSIEKNIPIYGIPSLSPDNTPLQSTPALASRLQDEWFDILTTGPGVLVLRGMYANHTILNSTNTAFSQLISAEESSSANKKKGDHFSPPGTNSRLWNSLSKHGLQDPESFVEYYSNPTLALVASAYLGPHYRVTAQLNIVKPGGPAQSSHRDYHLGFQSAEAVAEFPRATQIASSLLTLQGGIAHSDMPPTSGPTRFLPFSQLFEEGFLAYRREEFQSFFRESYISLPLRMGDGIFFNPAIFHAAGANQMSAESGFQRKANLLQISSAFGKAMESVDSIPVIAKCWDLLVAKARAAQALQNGDGDGDRVSVEVESFIKAVGEGYPFPTNLDRRAPGEGGMAPESEQGVLLRGLAEGWGVERVVAELRGMREDGRGVTGL